MKVVLPYVRTLNPEVVGAIRNSHHGGSLILWHCKGDDGYWKLLKRMWERQVTFTIVEHDIVVGPRTIDRLAKCQSEWCAVSYPYLEGKPYFGLGCAKFDTAVMQTVPDALDQVAKHETPEHPSKMWCALDSRLQVVLKGAGVEMCCHGEELLRHLYRGVPAHGCR